MRRKFLSVVLCVCMMLTMAPFAFAEGSDDTSTANTQEQAPVANSFGSGSGGSTTSVSLPNDNTGDLTISTDNAVLDGTGLTYTNGTITVTAANVTIQNLTFGDKAALVVNTTGKFTLTGCTFTPTTTYTKGSNNQTPTSVRTAVNLNVGEAVVTNNTFNGVASGYYNAIEFGIGASNNDLSKATITGNTFNSAIQNNYFNFYNMTTDAVIDIKDNQFLLANKGSNAIRISNYRNVAGVTFNIDNNKYTYASDSSESQYEGLILLQDFSNKNAGTQNFSGITLNITRLDSPSSAKQLLYVYDDQDGIISYNQPAVTGDNSIEKFAVAKVGDFYYPSLASAVAAATASDTVKLLKDVKGTASTSITKTVTIDLNGYSVTRTTAAANKNSILPTFLVNGGNLTINDTSSSKTGKVISELTQENVTGAMSNAVYVLNGSFTLKNGALTATTTATTDNTSWDASYGVYLSASATFIMENGSINATADDGAGYGVAVYKDCTFTLKDGIINSVGYAISGNGSLGNDKQPQYGNTSITIEGGKIVGNELAIYHPQSGNLTIKGGSLTGKGGIEAKAGNTTVTIDGNPTITATGTPTHDTNNNGNSSEGYAISVVENKNYAAGAKLTIASGYYNGEIKILRDNDINDEQKGSITITGGYFTSDPTAYLATGKGLVDSDLAGYYKVGNSKVNVDTKVKAGAPSVSIPTGSGLTEDDVKSAATSQATQASLAKAASSLTSDSNVVGTKEEAKTKLGSIAGNDSTITVVVQPYLDVKVTEVNNNAATMSVNISAQYNIIATTDPNNIRLPKEGENNANAVILKEKQDMSVSKPVTIKLPLPSNFDTAGGKLSIKHTKGNGSIEYYTGTVTTENNNKFVTFTTNGFSPFVIYAASANVASIGDGENEQVFTSFQAAVDAVENGGTIKALKNIDSTVSGNKSFKVNANDKTVKLTAASGYNLTKDATGKYTVFRQSSGGPGSSGGSISAPTTYNVNVNAATNGAVAADKKTASKGTMVTVTASPSKGYVVDAVKVVDKDGKDVAVTGKDGKYVFTMPGSAVTVTGTFKAETPAPVALPFSDVKSGNWFYDAVKYAYAQGLMTGTSATTFAPNGTMNRAMIVTVLYRLEKSPAVTGASKFTDVPAGQWYSDAVAWAAANKIVNGYDETTFGPMNAVTREQMAAILFRYEQYKGLENVTLEENLNRFPDQNKISAYAIPALQWAVGQKIINGNANGTLDPTGTATRAQVAQIFTNLLNQ